MNIYIEKSRLTQFGPLIDIEGHNIFSSYDVQIINGEIKTNIDLFVVGTHDTYNKLSEFGAPILNKVVWLKQYKKSSLIAQLNAFIEDEKFVKLDVAQIPEGYDWSQYSFKDKKYFVKYEYGARSLNTFIVDNTKISLAVFLSKLEKARTTKENPDKEKYKAVIQNLASLDGVEYIKGNTRHTDEEFEYSHLEFYPHEALTDIESEYRVIFWDNGALSRIFKRQRNENNNGVIDNELNYVEHVNSKELNSHIYNALTSLSKAIKTLNLYHGSIDLLMKSDGTWSIAEMSNQYGAGDIPANHKNIILKHTINGLINKVQS